MLYFLSKFIICVMKSRVVKIIVSTVCLRGLWKMYIKNVINVMILSVGIVNEVLELYFEYFLF